MGHLHVSNNNGTDFDSFRVEHIPKEIKNFIRSKNIITNISRMREYDLIKCGYFLYSVYCFYAKRYKFITAHKFAFS